MRRPIGLLPRPGGRRHDSKAILTVPNHAAIAIGDRIALCDKLTLLGISIVEEIVVEAATKILHRCPICGRAGIKPRERKTPRYRCQSCHQPFPTPVSTLKLVTRYQSRQDAAWVDLEGTLTVAAALGERAQFGSPWIPRR